MKRAQVLHTIHVWYANSVTSLKVLNHLVVRKKFYFVENKTKKKYWTLKKKIDLFGIFATNLDEYAVEYEYKIAG